MQDRSRDGLIEFLDWTGAKGLMPLATVQSRKATAGKVLAILNEQEAEDVSQIDIDELMSRFGNLYGKNYSPGSLKTYHSRLRGTLDDFRAYLDSPMNFKPSGTKRAPRKGTSQKEDRQTEPSAKTTGVNETGNKPAPVSAGVIPIPIRANLTVHIQGIPFDMTQAEARKIANVITALAMSEE